MLSVFEYRPFSMANVWLELVCWAFSLESFEEGFGYSTVPAISFSAHTARDSMAAVKGRNCRSAYCMPHAEWNTTGADGRRLHAAILGAGNAVSFVFGVELERHPVISGLHRSITAGKYSQLPFVWM